MKFNEYINLQKSDLYRYDGKSSFSSFIYHGIFTPGFKYTFWMRTCAFFSSHLMLRFLLFPFSWLILQHYEYKFGISIFYRTKISSGFYIGHFGSIIINQNSVIGMNCNISQDVTLGQSNRGIRKGYPVVGDSVYIGPGAKIIGNVRIGNNVAIGANCVVTKDIPDNSVVVGIPGKIISSNGSYGYINNADY